MSDSLQKELADKIKELENKIEEAYETGKEKFSYELKHGKAIFNEEIKKLHKKEVKNLLVYFFNVPLGLYISAPIIYAIFFPILLLDLFVTVYQWICMPIYKIPRVKRSDYITFDRHRLKYLNIIEKINCLYCSYINGFISYISEIAGRTELFFCPIKHARRLKKTHAHYNDFLDYGDYKNYKSEVSRLRSMFKELYEAEKKEKKTIKS